MQMASEKVQALSLTIFRLSSHFTVKDISVDNGTHGEGVSCDEIEMSVQFHSFAEMCRKCKVLHTSRAVKTEESAGKVVFLLYSIMLVV